MVLPAEPRVAGRVNEMVTGLLAWPVTSKRPAFVRSVAAIVLFTPGNTFPKFNCWAPVTLIGVWTLAVAVMLALLLWAWAVTAPKTSASTARDSLEIVRMCWCILMVSSCGFENRGVIRPSPVAGLPQGQGLCQPPHSHSLS